MQLKSLRAKCRKPPVEYDQILRDGRGFWDDVDEGYLPEDLVLGARREETAWVHSEGIYEIVPMQECADDGQKLLDLIWVDTDKSVDPAVQGTQDAEARQNIRILIDSQLFSAKPRLEVVNALVSIMMSVGVSSKGNH